MENTLLHLCPLLGTIMALFIYWLWILKKTRSALDMLSIIFPGWRFFSHIGQYPTLDLVTKLTTGEVTTTRVNLSPTPLLLSSLFFSPKTNHNHYLRTLCENLIDKSLQTNADIKKQFEYNYLLAFVSDTYKGQILIHMNIGIYDPILTTQETVIECSFATDNPND